MKIVAVLVAMFACFLLGIGASMSFQEKLQLAGDIEYVPSGDYKVVDANHPIYLLEGHSYRGSRASVKFYVCSDKSLGQIGDQCLVAPRMRR